MPLARALVGLVALAVFVPAAKADLYCVNTTSCAGGTAETDFQQALNDANVHSGPDTVQLGPGTFDSSIGFGYNASDPVHIIGAGAGATTVSDSGANPGVDTLNIAGSTASTVADMKLVEDDSGSFGSALDTVGSASDISALGTPGSGNVIGITAGPATVLSRVAVAVPLRGGSPTDDGVFMAPGSVLQDSTIQGDEAVVSDTAGAPVALRRLTITSDLEPVEADSGAIMSLQDSLVQSIGSNSVGLSALHSSAQVNAQNVTMVGPGTPGSLAITSGDTASVSFRNSIAVSYGKTFDTDASSSISTDYSDYAGTRQGAGAITEAHQLGVDPAFVNAGAGDYQLAAGSPLIDAGDPAGPLAGDSATDLGGNPRVSGARLDIGAYEFQFPPPPVAKDTTPPALSAVSETNKVFAVGGSATPISAKRVKTGTTFRYTLSEAAKVKLVIAQKLPGRRIGKACRKPSRRNRLRKHCTRFVKKGTLTRTASVGKSSVKFSGRIGHRVLRPGRYRVTITATDGAGNVSKHATLSFRVVKPARKKPHR